MGADVVGGAVAVAVAVAVVALQARLSRMRGLHSIRSLTVLIGAKDWRCVIHVGRWSGRRRRVGVRLRAWRRLFTSKTIPREGQRRAGVGCVVQVEGLFGVGLDTRVGSNVSKVGRWAGVMADGS